ncbi:hypothetical protein BN2127_JRS1_02595 [Bacillus cereus]|nr:hypothetical protein BN2127_JRS1_02595 [Bacillus cereus]
MHIKVLVSHDIYLLSGLKMKGNKERKSLVRALQKCNKNVSYCDSYFDNFFIQY